MASIKNKNNINPGFLVLVLRLGLITAAIACSSRISDDQLPRRMDDERRGHYRLHQESAGTQVQECNYVRSEMSTYSQETFNQKEDCNNLPPGLKILQHGFTQLAFPPLEGSKRLREVVFYFSCNNTTQKNINGFIQPIEVKYIQTVSRTFYDRQVVSRKDMLETFNKDVLLSSKENAFVFSLPLLRLNLTDTITSAAVEGFVVSLSNLKPAKQLNIQYRDLPTPFEKHHMSYYRFVSSYGTDVITSATFGGRVEVLVSSDRMKDAILAADLNNKNSIDGLINETIHMARNSYSRVTVYVEGGTPATRYDVRAWQSDVMKEPVPLYRTLLPLSKFLEPNGNSEQKRGLERMIKFEKENHDLRKILYELQVVRHNHKLADSLITILKQEVSKVCPNKYFYYLMKEGIMDPNNLGLTKFFISCSRGRWYSEREEKDLYIIKTYKMLPGFCFTPDSTFIPCLQAKMNLPKGFSCVQFFKNKLCTGASVTARNEAGLLKAFGSYYKSFVLCST